MKPYELINALVRADGGSLPVAKAMRAPGFQPTLNKYINGHVADPSRTTAERIAKHYGLPVDAIYDERVATKIAQDRGLIKSDDARAIEVGVAHDLSHGQKTFPLPETPKISMRDAVMNTPERFALEAEDDSMAPQISKGDVLRFARIKLGDRPRPGRIVLVADKSGRGYIRFFEDGGDEFTARPQPHSGYRPLEERRDGLRVIALWMGYQEE